MRRKFDIDMTINRIIPSLNSLCKTDYFIFLMTTSIKIY